jgi:hypothetical protein
MVWYGNRATETVVDDFEDGDISEYTGTTSGWSVTTGDQVNGQESLLADWNSSDRTIGSTSGLATYPTRGDVWRFHCRMNDPGSSNVQRAGMHFIGTDTSNSYAVELNGFTPNFRISDFTGGTQSTLQSTSQSYTDQWYEVEVDTSSGNDITCTLYDAGGTQQAQITATDSDHSGGLVGWRVLHGSGTPAETYFDYCRII